MSSWRIRGSFSIAVAGRLPTSLKCCWRLRAISTGSAVFSTCVSPIFGFVTGSGRQRAQRFLTEPLDNHGEEWRCYMRDPDGYLIEVGQYTQSAIDDFRRYLA